MSECESSSAGTSVSAEPIAWRPQVGDTVRVVLVADHACPEAPHFPGEAGRVGHVIKVQPAPGAATHAYLVMLDRPDPAQRPRRMISAIQARHYAASELELVRAADS